MRLHLASVASIVGLLASAPGCSSEDSGAPEPAAPLPVCGTQVSTDVHVVSISPADGELRTLRTPRIVVRLDAEIDCAGARASAFHLRDAAGADVPLGAVACEGAPTVLTLVPASDLAYATRHTLVVDGLSRGGRAIAACQSSFTTKAKTIDVSAGGSLSLARDEDGTVWVWGDPMAVWSAERMGDLAAPTRLRLGGAGVAMAAGGEFAVIALDDGSVSSFGSDQWGQLGDGTRQTTGTPVKANLGLPEGVRVIAIAAAQAHALALRSDGRVMAWGANGAGELGDGTKDERAAPIAVAGLSGVAAIGAGQSFVGHGSADGGWSIALKEDGSVWGWGANNAGQLAMPIADDADVPTPASMPAMPTARAIAAGAWNAYAIAGDGALWAWGGADTGSVGDGACKAAPRVAPVEVVLRDVQAISAGAGYAVALKKDGTVWGWGQNLHGVVGDGTTGATVDCSPDFQGIPHLQLAPKQAEGLDDVAVVSAGASHVLALRADGSVWAVGDDANGQLGVGPDVTLVDGTILARYARVPGL